MTSIRLLPNNGAGTYRMALGQYMPNNNKKVILEDSSNCFHYMHNLREDLEKTPLTYLSATRATSPYQPAFLSRRSGLFNLLVFEEVVTRIMGEAKQLMSTTLILLRLNQPQTSFCKSWEVLQSC